jgi:Zn-dependent protease with chaperone function
MPINYPKPPAVSDTSFLNPTAAFRANAIKVLGAILFFVIVYFILIAFAALLVLLCWKVGMAIVSATRITSITGILAVGIWVMGLFVMYFLIKFLFASNKVDRSGMIEITEEQEPEVFQFIRNITEETNAPLPKRIYLSPDVNASVSYDSSFWSMFLPVKKNLTIGLGLVNSTNLSEFKAIMGHEFGHFSQRSMKLGSYIYNVNRIIYDMLYNNNTYADLIDRWGSLHSIFALLMNISIWFVKAIQQILQAVYAFINKMYSGLSLQMEYHADAVAASVAGGNHLVTSLYRLEAADICYNTLISYYNEWIEDNFKAENVYRDHQIMMKQFAHDFNIPIEQGLIHVNQHSLSSFNQSNIVYKNQWASHPSNQEREQRLNELGLVTTVEYQSPWHLFSNAEAIQKQMTDLLFESVQYTGEVKAITEQTFNQKYEESRDKFTMPKVFGSYYNYRPLAINITEKQEVTEEIEVLFNDDNKGKAKLVEINEQDLQVLQQLKTGSIKSFDYKGVKYTKDQIDEVTKVIEDENVVLKKEINELDNKLYWLAYSKADNSGAQELHTAFETYLNHIKTSEENMKVLDDFRNHILEAYQEQKTPEQSILWERILKDKEVAFQSLLKNLITIPQVASHISVKQHDVLNAYLDYNHRYFLVDTYMNEALDKLHAAINMYVYLLNQYELNLKKDALAIQARLLFGGL